MNSPAPIVTIVVVPRDRFSCCETALESLHANTPPIFDLIVVDPGSPGYVQRYLDAAAVKYGFRLLRTDWGLTPNQARNLAIPHATGRHVIFIDNDVMVAPGWLDALIACADETGAGIVTPLVYVGEFEQRIVHMSGGELKWEIRDGQRWLDESHRHFNTPQAQINTVLKREPCGYAEFHCMLVRKSILEGIGLLDEKLLNVTEHIDLSLRSAEAGAPVWFEPAAQITFLALRPMALSDIPYFRLRWSRDWTERSCRHFAQQRQLHPDCPAVAGALNFGITHLAGQQLPNEPAQVGLFCAQTNIQLYEQCEAIGYSRDQLTLLRRCYESAQKWFGPLYRACGRPFLSHAIGTASLLAAHGATPQLVAAGMLHATYLHGTRAVDVTELTPDKRQQVANLVTPGVEYWLYLYATFDWKGTEIDRLASSVERLALPVGKTLLIKLARDLEEHVSHSTRYSAQADDALRRWLPVYVETVKQFDMPQLAERIRQAAGNNTGLSASVVMQAPGSRST